MTGNVRQRAPGSWTLTFARSPDPVTGRRRQGYATVRGTKKQALIRLAELQIEAHHGDYQRPSRMSVGDYLREWLDGQVVSTTRRNTSDGYDWYVRKYILPKIGLVPLRALQTEQVQAVYADMVGRGLSASTVRQAHRILRRALSQAVRSGHVTRNVADAATLPRQEQQEVKAMSADEVGRFLEAAQGSPYYAVFFA